MTPMTASRLCLIVSCILFILGGLDALNVLHLATATAFALFAFAFWVVSGAV